MFHPNLFGPEFLAQIRSARPISTSPQQTHREAEEFRPVGGHRHGTSGRGICGMAGAAS